MGRSSHHEADNDPRFRDLTMISAIVITKTRGLINKHIEFHPSGNIFCLKQVKGLSEIIVGEIVAKSPYEFRSQRACSLLVDM